MSQNDERTAPAPTATPAPSPNSPRLTSPRSPLPPARSARLSRTASPAGSASPTPSAPPPTSPTLTLVLQGKALGERLETALAEIDLSLRKMGLLGHLRATPGISFSALARRAGIKVQSLHPIIDDLMAHQLVTTVGAVGQGRAAAITLTASGEQALVRAQEVLSALDREVFASGPWQELGQTLTVIAENFLRTAE